MSASEAHDQDGADLRRGDGGRLQRRGLWLATHERELIDAQFALNEGGGGQLDAAGHRVLISVEAAEKTPQNYDLTVTNAGGHSSRPVKPNAIYQLSAGLLKVGRLRSSQCMFDDANRAYFTAMAKLKGGEQWRAMR